MRKSLLLLFISSSIYATAQQDGIYSSEGFNTFEHNPASYGNGEFWSVNTFGRLQWVGVDGAPKSIHVNGGVQLPLGILMNWKRNLTIIAGSSYMYKEVGFQKIHTWNFAIGMPIRIGKETELKFAIAPGIYATNLGSTWIFSQSSSDSLQSRANFDLSAGMLYRWKSLYVGFSVTHLLAQEINNSGFRLARHYHLQAGYKVPVGQHYLYPMLQAKFDGAGMVLQSMNYFVFKNNLFSLGAGYRVQDAILLGAAFEFKGFRLGYNYDITLNPLAAYSSGSHELRLSYIRRI
ncbi:MAG: PorP/SprF family type IX secretion system membrane protein [Crocinitomicaceae bacterium]|nr:PorP/SprF family type IX secretion system membrane protein [Crocinitomicaceae bacterium]